MTEIRELVERLTDGAEKAHDYAAFAAERSLDHAGMVEAHGAIMHEAASALTSLYSQVEALKAELLARDVDIAFLLGDSPEMTEEAGAVRTEAEAFVWSMIRSNLTERLASRGPPSPR